MHCPIAFVVRVHCSIVHLADVVISYCAPERQKDWAHTSHISIDGETTSHLGFWGCKIRRVSRPLCNNQETPIPGKKRKRDNCMLHDEKRHHTNPKFRAHFRKLK
jgi:hypothetical protein